MVHAYSINSLKGCEYYIKQCTCGHEEKLKKVNIDFKIQIAEREFCPKCGTPLMCNSINDLTFAPTIQKGNIANLKTYNRACFFELELYSINFVSKIDFQKKKIKIDKRTIKNDMIKIVFDASQKPEDFIKYYDKNNNEIDKESFVNKIPEESSYELDNCKDIEKKFTLLSGCIIKYLNLNRINYLIKSLESNKEFFIKYEQIIKSNIDPYPIMRYIDLTKTNPIEMLGIRPFTFKYIRERKTSISSILLKTIKEMEAKIGDQTVNYLQTFGQRPECMNTNFINSVLDLTCDAGLSINKLYKYVYKDVPMKQFITDPVDIITLLRDSFEMSKELGLVFNKNSKTLKRYHDELVEEYKTIEDKVLANKFKRKMENRTYLNFEDKDSEYCIIIPTDSKELIKEGQELKHCVGSYIKKVALGKCAIAFLRKKKTPDKSYTTIEISDEDEIIQIRKKHNAFLTEKDAVEFIKKWCKEKNLTNKVL